MHKTNLGLEQEQLQGETLMLLLHHTYFEVSRIKFSGTAFPVANTLLQALQR